MVQKLGVGLRMIDLQPTVLNALSVGIADLSCVEVRAWRLGLAIDASEILGRAAGQQFVG